MVHFKPMKTLELHYLMTQFFITRFIKLRLSDSLDVSINQFEIEGLYYGKTNLITNGASSDKVVINGV